MHAHLPSRVQMGAVTPSITVATDTAALRPNAPTPAVSENLSAERLDALIEFHAAQVEWFMGKAMKSLDPDATLYYHAEANRHDITLSRLRLQRGKA